MGSGECRRQHSRWDVDVQTSEEPGILTLGLSSVVVSDFVDENELPWLPYDERVAHACLGCLCAGPEHVSQGNWVLLLEDDDGCPVAVGHVGLVFDSISPPIVTASSALSRAGYEHAQTIVTKPWAAEWSIIRPEDRLPT